MDIKLQKQKEKNDRKYFLSEKPIIRSIRECKHLDNVVDVKKYLTKHWTNIQHNECNVFGSGNSVYWYDSDEGHYIIHIKKETPLDHVLVEIESCDFSENYVVSSLWLNRVEKLGESEERQILIERYSRMRTEELLNFRRHAGPAGFYLDGWQRQVLKAILDGREHVLNAKDRKELRVAKAKLQKTY
jgi:hypothetical protein